MPTELPEFVFEWIGRTVADRLDMIEADCRSELAHMRATVAELRADNAELKGQVRELLDRAKNDIAARLASLQPEREISEAEFEHRIETALAVEHDLPQIKMPPINVTVPVILPKRGKEIMTVELDEAGRIKRSIKEEAE